MAVTFDAVGPSAAGQAAGNSASMTWSHTCAGANRYVVVGASLGASPDTGRTLAATFAGSAMTSLGSIHTNNGPDGLVQLFGFLAPAVGASTVVVTASTASDLTGGSVSFNGVHQTTPVGTAVTAAGFTAAPTVSVTGTTAGNMVVDTACDGVGFASSGQTSRYINNFNGGTGAGSNAGSTAAGGGTVTMSYTASASDLWGIVAVEVRAAPTAPDQFPTAVTVGSWTNVGGAGSAVAALSDASATTYLLSPTPPSAATPLLLTMGALDAGGITFYVEGATGGGSATRTVTVYKADGTTQIYSTSYTVTTTVVEQAVTLDATALAAIPALADRTALVVKIADVPA